MKIACSVMSATESNTGQMRRMVLADALAASIDSARRQQSLEKPLLNWCEGDAIVQLLKVLAELLSGEPMAELSAELADELRARLGPPPGYDVNAALRAIADDLQRHGPAPAPED
ncbi:hypothetical protein [Microbispora hainanensis]|uniref:hypothetical protein n=1 Tax=Microbispora hainanensis TaxID=568844 RepID=UPI0033DB5BE6